MWAGVQRPDLLSTFCTLLASSEILPLEQFSDILTCYKGKPGPNAQCDSGQYHIRMHKFLSPKTQWNVSLTSYRYDNSAQQEVWLLNAKMINAKIIFMIFKKRPFGLTDFLGSWSHNTHFVKLTIQKLLFSELIQVYSCGIGRHLIIEAFLEESCGHPDHNDLWFLILHCNQRQYLLFIYTW